MQNYNNHIRYYFPHHFIFYPLILILIFLSARNIFWYPDDQVIWTAITVLFMMLMWVSYMMRQHYALTVQNRVVRLEMRQRYFELTGQRFAAMEQKLSFGQIAALRFASDEELIPLIERAISENLTPAIIKKNIRNWEPDHMRV
jgi:phosphoglycerol transferase MdoB-like AlkP superfamily enzyme